MLCKLLKHGALGIGEIYEITRWDFAVCEAAVAAGIKARRVLVETPNGMAPLYRLNVFFRRKIVTTVSTKGSKRLQWLLNRIDRYE